MWWKKRLMILSFLFYLCCSLVHSQDLVFNHIDWNALDQNLNTIELNFQMLKTENDNLQTQLMNAGNLLSEQEKYSANQSILLAESENKYAKLKKTTRLWKIGCCSFMITTISTTIALIMTRR